MSASLHGSLLIPRPFRPSRTGSPPAKRGTRTGACALPGLLAFLLAPLMAPLLAPGPLQAQENDAATAIPSVGGTIESIRFFEAAPPLGPRADRSYATRFDANRTRFIYTDVVVRHPPTEEEGISFEIACTYHGPTGEGTGTTSLRFQPGPAWERSAGVNALGSERTGAFGPGFHRVACTHEGAPVVESGFEVFEGAPALAMVEGHLSTLRYFAWEETLPPLAERSYQTGFEGATTRRISLEFRLRFEPPGRLVMIPVSCRVVGPDGAVVSESDQQVRVEPTWQGVTGGMTVGDAEARAWTPGMHVGTCTHGDTVLGEARFVVR